MVKAIVVEDSCQEYHTVSHFVPLSVTTTGV